MTAAIPIRHQRTLLREMALLGDALESMIQTQMTAYPDHWTEAERRELAEQHLFATPTSAPAPCALGAAASSPSAAAPQGVER